MEIIPNGTIHFLKNIPLDPTYENTIFFEDEAAQQAYFQGQVITGSQGIYYNVDNSNYVRLTKGKIKVKTIAEVINTCNYCFFRNSVTVVDFEEGSPPQDIDFKWIYAFVTNVNYINFGTAEVEFEIDLMQTYMFDYRLGSCLIDREHSRNDNINPHNGSIDPSLLTSESLNISDYDYEYLIDDTTNLPCFDSYNTNCTVVWVSALCYGNNLGVGETWGYTGFWYSSDPEGTVYSHMQVTPITSCLLVNNQMNAIIGYNFEKNRTGQDKLNRFLDILDQRGLGDAVYSINDYPVEVGKKIINIGNMGFPTTPFVDTIYINPDKIYSRSFGNYTVKNNKLLAYPYNTLVATTFSNEAEYKFHLFDHTLTGNIMMAYVATFDSNPTIGCIPIRYDGLTENWREMLSTTGFNKGVWASDFYKNWYAFHDEAISNSQTVNYLGAVFNTMTSALTANVGGMIGGTMSAVNRATELENQMSVAASQPPHIMGNVNQSNLLSVNNRLNVHILVRRAKDYCAKQIDDFFTMFGYRCGYVKVPNRNVRPYYTYTKTVNCYLEANDIPSEYIAKIKAIYDNGIRFWRYRAGEPMQIGAYNTLDNRPSGA